MTKHECELLNELYPGEISCVEARDGQREWHWKYDEYNIPVRHCPGCGLDLIGLERLTEDDMIATHDCLLAYVEQGEKAVSTRFNLVRKKLKKMRDLAIMAIRITE